MVTRQTFVVISFNIITTIAILECAFKSGCHIILLIVAVLYLNQLNISFLKNDMPRNLGLNLGLICRVILVLILVRSRCNLGSIMPLDLGRS